MNAVPLNDDPALANASSGPPPDDLCPQCESERLIARHCKRLCPRCGYVESCEDLFPDTCDQPPT